MAHGRAEQLRQIVPAERTRRVVEPALLRERLAGQRLHGPAVSFIRHAMTRACGHGGQKLYPLFRLSATSATAGEPWGGEILPKRRRRDPVSAAAGHPRAPPRVPFVLTMLIVVPLLAFFPRLSLWAL